MEKPEADNVDKLNEYLPAGVSMARMAPRWILDHDAVSVIIPGASSPARAKENAAISDMDFCQKSFTRRFPNFTPITFTTTSAAIIKEWSNNRKMTNENHPIGY